MFIKIVTVVFYAAIMFWALGGGDFLPLMLIIGVCAAILAIANAM